MLWYELQKISAPHFALVAAAYGQGPESSRTYLIVRHHDGAEARIELPDGSRYWLQQIFHHPPTWTEAVWPSSSEHLTEYACTPLVYVAAARDRAGYLYWRCKGVSGIGQIPECLIVQLSLYPTC